MSASYADGDTNELDGPDGPDRRDGPGGPDRRDGPGGPDRRDGPDGPDGPDGFEDGNALAGPLGEIFAIDVTAATSRCVSCGRLGQVAELRVYRHAPGLVARCAGCGEVVLRIVRAPDAAWLDLSGTTSLRIPLAPHPSTGES